MKTLHDSTTRAAILARIDQLEPDSPRLWGKMRIDQMLRHLNAALEMTLGRLPANDKPTGIPRPLLKFMVLNLPWPKGKAPTAPELIAADTYEFEAERQKLKKLVDEVAQKSVEGVWLQHPAFGTMTGRESTKLQYKHIDHHLRQFGA